MASCTPPASRTTGKARFAPLRDEPEDDQLPLFNIAPEYAGSCSKSLGARPKTKTISLEDTQRFDALMKAVNEETRIMQGLLEPHVKLARMLNEWPGSVSNQRMHAGHEGE